MPGDVEQVFHRVGNTCQRRQRAFLPTQGVDILGFGQHAFFRDGGPGVDMGIDARNGFQGLAGDVMGAQVACTQRLLDLTDTHLV